jgi:hypothetical protein
MVVSLLDRKVNRAIRNFNGIKSTEDKYENGTPVILAEEFDKTETVYEFFFYG